MALDNIRIERLWRSLKYEDIYLKRYEKMKDLKAGINAYSGIHVPIGKSFCENFKDDAVKFSVRILAFTLGNIFLAFLPIS